MKRGRRRSFYSWLVTSWSGKLGVSYLSIFFSFICLLLLVSALIFLSMSLWPILWGTLPTLTWFLLVSLSILFIAGVIYYWYWWHKEDFVPLRYHHLKHQTLERIVKLNLNAKRDGRSENPAEGSVDISKTESDVKLEANQHVEQQVRINKKLKQKLEKGLSDSKDLMDKNPHSYAVSEIKGELDNFFDRVNYDMKEYHLKIQLAYVSLTQFKEDNQLDRSPYVRHFWHVALAVLLITGLIVGEAKFNSNLFSAVMQGGSDAAFALAVGISLINVGMSFLIGWLIIPNLWNSKLEAGKRWGRRIFAFLMTISYILFIAYVNLSAGVFRGIAVEQKKGGTGFSFDSISTQAAQDLDGVFWPFSADALEFLDFESQLFIGLGVLFAIISLIDGLFFDDTYPGFGAFGRRLEKVQNALHTKVRRYKREFKSLFVEANLESDFVEEQRAEALSNWEDIHDCLQETQSGYESLLDSVRKAAEHALEQYKAINKRNRSTSGPLYWLNPEIMAAPQMLPFEKQYSSVFSEMIDDIQKTEAKSTYKDKIFSERNNHQSNLDEIRTETQKKLKEMIDNSNDIVNELAITQGRRMEIYNR